MKGFKRKIYTALTIINRKISPNSSSLKENIFKTSYNKNLLLSYITSPFLYKISNSHSNNYECFSIATIFKNNKFNVDVIDWNDAYYIPNKNYDAIIDIHSNLERLFPYLSNNSYKILHITGAHWSFHNNAELNRINNLFLRKGYSCIPRRQVPPSKGIDFASHATTVGNSFTIETFGFSNKTINRIPISAGISRKWVPRLNMDKIKRNFIWFGGGGLVHKGLDLVLEAFIKMPYVNLTVIGPIRNEPDFLLQYNREINNSKNIRVLGWLNSENSKFSEICNNSIGIIFPSCSEGGGGSAITAMKTGLIPIVTRESSVDLDPFGLLLDKPSVNEIMEKVNIILQLPNDTLQMYSEKISTITNLNYSESRFFDYYNQFVKNNIK